MAGIGLALRCLTKRNNLLGLAQAYVTSALASMGPWLLTVIALAGIMGIGNHFVTVRELEEFRVILTYNFSFSLVFSGPVCMVATRYLADALYRKDISPIPGIMLMAFGLLYIIQLPVITAFYLFYVDISRMFSVLAIINFLLISSLWLVSVFLTTVKDYATVIWAFITGMTTAIALSSLLAKYYGTLGMLAGFSIGICLIVAFLVAKILSTYPYPPRWSGLFLSYFRKYWEITLGGMVYNAAIWVDKWVMWFAPEAHKIANTMVIYPHYDSAMFLAYLTILPSAAMFLFSIETNFLTHYVRFYRDIHSKASYKKIERNHREMIGSIFSSSGNFLIIQGGISLMAILLAPKIFSLLGSNYQQIGIFRYGVLGALFHALFAFLLLLLSYFDNRKAVFSLQLLFLGMNALFTIITLHLGFSYYGYGYFLASIIGFIVAVIITASYLTKLPYHTFITMNTSVR